MPAPDLLPEEIDHQALLDHLSNSHPAEVAEWPEGQFVADSGKLREAHQHAHTEHDFLSGKTKHGHDHSQPWVFPELPRMGQYGLPRPEFAEELQRHIWCLHPGYFPAGYGNSLNALRYMHANAHGGRNQPRHRHDAAQAWALPSEGQPLAHMDEQGMPLSESEADRLGEAEGQACTYAVTKTWLVEATSPGEALAVASRSPHNPTEIHVRMQEQPKLPVRVRPIRWEGGKT